MAQSNPLGSSARNPQLDGLRALAIALVVVAHAVRVVDPRQNAGREALGEIGVSLFFVLSGFLITTLLLQERERRGKIDLGDFYVRRARRIFPAYYVYLGVLAVLSALGVATIGWQEFVLDAFYLRDYNAHSALWLEHTWSLAVETQFYLLWPAALIFLGSKRAQTAAIAVVILAPLVRIATYFLIPSQRDLMTIAFHTRVDMLMFGCATALLIEHGTPAWLTAVSARLKPAVCLAILTVCVLGTAYLRGTFQFSIGMSLEGAACAFLLFSVLHEPGAMFAKVLTASPVTWLGRISYSLYLWQQPFLLPVAQSPLARFPLNILAAIAVACASYYLVERSFFRAKPVSVSAV